MRPIALIVALVLVAAAGATAVAQYAAAPVVTPEFEIKPRKAGTKRKPANVSVYTKGTINPESNSTLRRLEYVVPRTIRLDGRGFKRCSPARVNSQGEAACPRRSRIGTGATTALLGPQRTPLEFDVAVFAAGPRRLTISLTGLFNLAIPAKIRGRVVGFDLPERLQQPVRGLYAYVTSIESRLGRQRGIPGRVRTRRGKVRFFASSVGCRRGRHSGKVRAFLAPNPEPPAVPVVTVRAASRCR